MKRTLAFVTAGFLGLFGVPFVLPFLIFDKPAAHASICMVTPEDARGMEPVSGYKDDQLENAAIIMNAAFDMELGLRGQQIGVMTAMEESTLRNISYGDNAINPDGTIADSIGLFQQQGHWGSVKERMDPYTSATLFFTPMKALKGWEELPPETVAHTVQVNDAAWRYAEHWEEAQAVVQALSEASNCGPGTIVDGWTNPIGNQPWGTRPDHSGGAMDIHVGVGTPVYAPAAGKIYDLSEGCGGTVIGVQHDAQYTTVFAHMNQATVTAGQTVKGGELIGYSGESGSCVQGAHLHFEVRVGPNPHNWGAFTPAYKFMRERGVTMGPCVSFCDAYPM